MSFKVYTPTYVPAYLTGKLSTADTQDTQQTVAQDYASATNPVALTIRQTGLSSKASLGMSGAQEPSVRSKVSIEIWGKESRGNHAGSQITLTTRDAEFMPAPRVGSQSILFSHEARYF